VSRTRIKICGITRVSDAETALALGVDAIGLVFYGKSPRSIAVSDASDIARAVGPFVTVTGLFVDAVDAEIQTILQRVPLHVLQFHGDETPEFCQQFRRPWIKAIRMAEQVDLEQESQRYARASGILLDSYKPGVPGGTGECFDWTRAASSQRLPVVLAGGLTAQNVAAAIRAVRPYAVDVSGGVESAPGHKDAEKMRAFVDAVNSAGS